MSPRSAEWLRTLYSEAVAAGELPSWRRDDVEDPAAELASMLRCTPAWTEPYRVIVDRLIGLDLIETSASAWFVAAGGDAVVCPQIVDVDVGSVVLTRAEWQGESLGLTLAPSEGDSTRITQFRIVGVEPRVWWQTGIDGATTDVRGDYVIVRCPLVAGHLDFDPSSY